MSGINYAAQYARELAQAYPYSLNFGALYATPNNGRYRMGEDGKTIYIPNLSTTGRVAADRDTIATATRNYDNAWEPKVLSNQRKWSTLVHPKDIDQTNEVASIANITQTFNEEQKFPEMDAYCISQLYKLWTTSDTATGYVGKTPNSTTLTVDNVLNVFDAMMLEMDNARVPANGRILYCTNEVKILLKQASGLTRNFDVQSGGNAINRSVSRIEEVEITGVPSTLMKTKYDFSAGWKIASDAKQVNMCLVHPSAIITPVSYQFSQLDPPSAVTEGKYIYYEESFEDVFILNKKADGIQFNISAGE
jgi:putative phage major capsid protein